MLDQKKNDHVNHNDTVNTYHDCFIFHFTSFYVILLYCLEANLQILLHDAPRANRLRQNNTCPTSRDNRIREQPQKYPQHRHVAQETHSYIH